MQTCIHAHAHTCTRAHTHRAQVVLTAILWGAGTALGEVPPYLISYSGAAAGKKEDRLKGIEEVCRGGVRGWGR